MAKLSKRTVTTAQPKAQPYLVFDDDVRGFALRVHPSGEKTFVMRYRFGGADRKLSLGHFGSITAEKARALALKARATLADRKDPGAERRRLSASAAVESLGERFMREHVSVRCKPSTQGEYRRALDLFINRKLGRRRVAEVTRADVAEIHHAYAHIPYQANRTLGVLSNRTQQEISTARRRAAAVKCAAQSSNLRPMVPRPCSITSKGARMARTPLPL